MKKPTMKTQDNYYTPPVLQEQQIGEVDYKRLKNKPKGGSGIRKFVLDVYQTSGVKPTRNFAPIRGGNVGDIYVSYPEINILGHGNMRAHITKVSNVGDVPISLKKGDIVSVRGRIYSNNGAFGLTFSGGTYRLLFGTSMAINRSNPQTDFIVTSDGTLDLKYADDGNSNFISAISITIN